MFVVNIIEDDVNVMGAAKVKSKIMPRCSADLSYRPPRPSPSRMQQFELFSPSPVRPAVYLMSCRFNKNIKRSKRSHAQHHHVLPDVNDEQRTGTKRGMSGMRMSRRHEFKIQRPCRRHVAIVEQCFILHVEDGATRSATVQCTLQ